MATYLTVYALMAAVGLALPGRAPPLVLALLAAGLIVFMGLRFEVGCDFSGYFLRFEAHPTHLSWSDLTRPEVGFAALSAFVKGSGGSYSQFLVVVSAILVVCYAIFAAHHRHGLLILALLFPVIIVQLGMSGLRQALAGGFLLLATVAFQKAKPIRTAVWILIAMQFHTSAALFLPMALLAGRTVSVTRIALALVVLGPLAALLMGPRFDTYSDRYIAQVGGEITSSGAIFRYALIMIPVAVFAASHRRFQVERTDLYPLVQLFALIAVALAPLILLSTIALHRLGYYIMPISIVTFVALTDVAVRAGQEALARWVPVLVYGAYSVLWFSNSSHAARCYIPYQWVL